MSVFERDRWWLKLGDGGRGMGCLDTMVSYNTVSTVCREKMIVLFLRRTERGWMGGGGGVEWGR